MDFVLAGREEGQAHRRETWVLNFDQGDVHFDSTFLPKL